MRMQMNDFIKFAKALDRIEHTLNDASTKQNPESKTTHINVKVDDIATITRTLRSLDIQLLNRR